jgi:hypothetical protein
MRHYLINQAHYLICPFACHVLDVTATLPIVNPDDTTSVSSAQTPCQAA